MKKDVLRRSKVLSDFLGLPKTFMKFHLEWYAIMHVYDKIRSIDNNRWDIEIINNKITFVDRGNQRYEWVRTNEDGMIELLFYATSQYIGYGLFNNEQTKTMGTTAIVPHNNK